MLETTSLVNFSIKRFKFRRSAGGHRDVISFLFIEMGGWYGNMIVV
ncbi:Uncharacterized protein APZ42_002611 [Daphnia magna]|uniref:Uncharacterized protein n=1 Tax=Daphnia magna TaxID=35525 RepID=A0A164I5P0_9CRUS|nr:Uncharacterized protein APZ42_002611 [Daphnia magna]